MDHSNAQSTFLEIAFGINTVFTVYKGLRNELAKWMDGVLASVGATINAIEPNGNVERLNHVKKLASDVAEPGMNSSHA